jgi:hypothetical protein
MKILLVAASLCLAACASTGPDTVMKMRKITAERMISSADAPEDRDVAVSTVGIGPSVPDSDPIHNINPGKMVRLFRDSGPSRISGGERFSFTLLDANKKPYTDQLVAVRVIAYSKSGKGKLLVRNAEAVPAQPAPFFDPLFRFSALPTGAKAEQHGDNVLLSDHEHVILYQDNAFPLSRIILAVEGFGDNDSSFAVQTVSATLGKVGTSTDVRRAIVNPPPACPSGYFQASHSVCCPDGTRFEAVAAAILLRKKMNLPRPRRRLPSPRLTTASATPTPTAPVSLTLASPATAKPKTAASATPTPTARASPTPALPATVNRRTPPNATRTRIATASQTAASRATARIRKLIKIS